ncbi:hypothetical protein [Amycolatopsis sp. lyj-108]|uniref:hypothetical protein n=1 Tax=Amycolatopsis sp. lyj-108 TaxID=2789286 RepID=UPI00397B8F31
MTEDGGSLPELPDEVASTIMRELPTQGARILACLRTASVLIVYSLDDEADLRLAESAAYNVREAVDAVVKESSPLPGGGLSVVREAWQRYEAEIARPDNDGEASLAALTDVLRRIAEKRDRDSYHAARLLQYLRSKAGIDPLSGELDPVKEYTRLYGEASQALHSQTTLQAAVTLYSRAVAWFIRMFTPSDEIVRALRALATEPWSGHDQVERLRNLALNEHHLRLFLGLLTDPGWLTPLYDANVIALPTPSGTWPGAALLEGLGRTAPAEVAVVLMSLVKDVKQRTLKEDRANVAFTLLLFASQLGSAGHSAVGHIVSAYSSNRSVRVIGADVIKKADPTIPLVETVARKILKDDPLDTDRYYYKLVLERLEAGLNRDNATSRIRMLAAKTREASQHHQAGWITRDSARLTADLGEHDRHYLVILAHGLARLLEQAPNLGISTADLLKWTKDIGGDLGERITSRVLALAADVPIHDKIDHITRRLASSAPTGDDKDLIDAVLLADPEPGLLAPWAEALGLPGDDPVGDGESIPAALRRAWHWSTVLPGSALESWQDRIAELEERHGSLPQELFEHRTDHVTMMSGQSAYSAKELSSLSVADAIDTMARWRPDSDSRGRMVLARELARTLEGVVEAEPQAWTADPVSVVTALREPVYVLHYFDAVAKKAADVVESAPDIVAAAQLVRTERWTPIVLGEDDFDFEPDWRRVEQVTVDLVRALANHDTRLADHLDTVWAWALELIDRAPESGDAAHGDHDALFRAINGRRGKGLQAILSLAGWEYRNGGVIRPQFVELLDELVRIPGPVGMEYRAVLAQHRRFLETIAKDWLGRRVDTLFRDTELGIETLELTLKYAQPTPWLYANLRDELIAAARQNADNAVDTLLVGMLRRETGYEIPAVLQALRGCPEALTAASSGAAVLVQGSTDGEPELDAAAEFWRALLDANRVTVPADALRAAGRWAFVTGLPEETWAQLMVRTLAITGGVDHYAIEVADRCRTAPVPDDSTKILLMLLGNGAPWEQDYVARASIDALRTIGTTRFDPNFDELRTKVIDRGYPEATDIDPYADPNSS